MASKNHRKRKKRKNPKRGGIVVERGVLGLVPCSQCYRMRIGQCDGKSRHTERCGFLKLRKRIVAKKIDYCSNGVLDVGYARKYYDEHKELIDYRN